MEALLAIMRRILSSNFGLECLWDLAKTETYGLAYVYSTLPLSTESIDLRVEGAFDSKPTVLNSSSQIESQ